MLDGLEGDADGWVFLGELKSRMLQIDAAFDNANHGARTFTAFLELPLLAKQLETRRAGLRVDVRRKRPRVAKAQAV